MRLKVRGCTFEVQGWRQEQRSILSLKPQATCLHDLPTPAEARASRRRERFGEGRSDPQTSNNFSPNALRLAIEIEVLLPQKHGIQS